MVPIFTFIIWQGSLEVNLSIAIGSFLVGICYTDHFHRKDHKPCISVYESHQIQNMCCGLNFLSQFDFKLSLSHIHYHNLKQKELKIKLV